MSSDDFARHIAQKYRLAISIAILKTKPENLSIDEHFVQIKNIIMKKNGDDMNISTCSDDFNMNSSEDLNDDQNYINQNRLSQDNHDFLICNANNACTSEINDRNSNVAQTNVETEFIDSENHYNDNETQLNDVVTQGDAETQFNDDKVRGNDGETKDNTQSYETRNYIDTQVNDNNDGKDINTNKTLLDKFEEASLKTDVNIRREEMREVIKVLKGDVITTYEVNKRKTPFDYKHLYPKESDEENNNNLSKTIELNNTEREYSSIFQENSDSKQNLEDTSELRKEIKKRMNTNVRNNVSNPKIAKKVNKIENKNKPNIDTNTNNIASNNSPQCVSDRDQNEAVKNIATDNNSLQGVKDKDQNEAVKNIAKDNNSLQGVRDRDHNEAVKNIATDNNSLQGARDRDQNEAVKNIATDNNSLQGVKDKDQNEAVKNIETDSQKTHYTVTQNTQFNTHYSQSQTNHIVFDSRLIYGTNKINTRLVNVDNQNICNRTQNQNSIENDTAFLLDAYSMDAFPNKDSSRNNKNQSVGDNIISQYVQNIDANELPIEANATNIDNTSVEGSTVLDKTKDIGSDKNTLTYGQDSMFDKTTDVDSVRDNLDLTDGQKKIPFKIIEETNRIKMYLRRKEMQHSGYMSSQTKCSFGGTQPQIVGIGQTAYSIFNYLSSCSLVTATQDLTEQISEVLGQLIDRLHEEETYPPFLEDLLSAVDKYLQSVYEDDNYGFDVLQKKDEQIQRILILNKSTHIQKYTIEKINNILQKWFNDISADTNDIQNIDKIENLCYIFQILQIILPKYISIYNQSSQNSEDEKYLKKRNITDLWRKKWFNIKKNSNEGSLESKCVLRECSLILNKIIVNLMDGFSLIAYCALHCFNMMQP